MVVDWPAEHERRVLALRLVAPQSERFAGRSLRQALAAEGFLLGQFAIFHKPDDERRAVLSAASLTRPGTFDMETMDSQHYGGLSLFAVLPGPKPAPQTFDELVFAARNLNERLQGVLQDEQGTPLTPARIAQLREQLRMGAAS
jgi:cell division protein ZipA